jgi:HNH endonuclease
VSSAVLSSPNGRLAPQACGVRRRLDVHHVVKRSQGGSDFDLDLLVALCRWCHDQTDAPYKRGRLVVTALGAGQLMSEVVRRPGRGDTPNLAPTFACAAHSPPRPGHPGRPAPADTTLPTGSDCAAENSGCGESPGLTPRKSCGPQNELISSERPIDVFPGSA